MFMVKTDRDFFVSTGKIATRTLETIGNAEITTNQDPKNIEIFKKANPNYNINIIIRYPWHRFTSGLFEIFGKSLIYIFSQQLNKYYKDDVVKIIPMFYDVQMWIDVINSSIKHLPTFDKNKKLSSDWLEFHMENWLENVEYMKHNIESNIIDIDDLSLYLDHNHYAFTITNRSADSIICTLSNLADNKDLTREISKNINGEKMMGAYRKAVSCCDRANEFLEYLYDENEIYKKLIAKRLILDPNNKNLKVL